jgi:hypothetical protein
VGFAHKLFHGGQNPPIPAVSPISKNRPSRDGKGRRQSENGADFQEKNAEQRRLRS